MKYALCAIAFLASAHSAAAISRESQVFYSLSFPTAGVRDFLSQTSILGFGIEGTEYFKEGRFGIGFSASWIYFSQNEPSYSKSIDAYPLYLRFLYVETIGNSPVHPFGGVGLGTIYGQLLYESIGSSSNTVGWQLAVAPELGIQWRPSSQFTALSLSLRYDLGFGTDNLPALTILRVNAGISWGF